jgi:AcrR family transcriptional regulator
MQRDTCDNILDAVDHLLARYGYQKMTMDDIAREAGISKRTIYLNFTNKEELALSSIDRVVQRLLEQLVAVAQTADAPHAKLRRMLLTRVLFRFDCVQAYYQSFDELFAALRPAYMARRERYFDREAQLLAEVLETGRQAGAFAFQDALQTAHTLLLATNSLLPYSLNRKELGAREDVVTKLSRISDLLLDGLRPRENSGEPGS